MPFQKCIIFNANYITKKWGYQPHSNKLSFKSSKSNIHDHIPTLNHALLSQPWSLFYQNQLPSFHTRKVKPSFRQLRLLYPHASRKFPNPKQYLKTQLTIPKHCETCHSRTVQLLDWSDKPSFTSYYAQCRLNQTQLTSIYPKSYLHNTHNHAYHPRNQFATENSHKQLDD